MARINTDEGKGIETAKHAKYAKRRLAGWQVLAGAGWSVLGRGVFRQVADFFGLKNSSKKLLHNPLALRIFRAPFVHAVRGVPLGKITKPGRYGKIRDAAI